MHAIIIKRNTEYSFRSRMYCSFVTQLILARAQRTASEKQKSVELGRTKSPTLSYPAAQKEHGRTQFP